MLSINLDIEPGLREWLEEVTAQRQALLIADGAPEDAQYTINDTIVDLLMDALER